MGSEVGREVRRLREERGWGQAKLAVEAGMAVSGVSQIENGKRNPNSATLLKLARALGVEVADLFPKAEAPLWSDEPVEERRVSLAALTAWAEYLELMLQRWRELETELRSLLAQFLSASEEHDSADLQLAVVRTREFIHGVWSAAQTADQRLFRNAAFDVGQLEADEREALRLIQAKSERLYEMSQYFMHFLDRLEGAIDERLQLRQIVDEFLESARLSEQSTEEVR